MASLNDLVDGFKAIFGFNSNFGIGEFRSNAQIQEALSLQGIANIRNRNQRIIDENQPIGNVREFENIQRPILESKYIGPFNSQISQVQSILDKIPLIKTGSLDRSSADFLYKNQGSFSNLHPISQQNILNIQYNEAVNQAYAPIRAILGQLQVTKSRNQQGIDEIFNIVAPNSV